MKRLIFPLVFTLFFADIAWSQVTLRFSGQLSNGGNTRMDSVVVENITRSWSETLVYPDTVIIFANNSVCDVHGRNMSIESYPNPFRGTATMRFSATYNGDYALRLLSLTGQVLSENKIRLNAGENLFEISLKKAQVAILTVSSEQGQISLKIIGSGGASADAIRFMSNFRVGEKRQTAQPFAIGDSMRFTGYVTLNDSLFVSNQIQQRQNGSEFFRLLFDLNNLLPTITTTTIRDITAYSILSGSTMQNSGTPPITEWGLCWNTNPHPTPADNRFVPTSTTPLSGYSFSNIVTGFAPGTTYHIRAYATNAYGISYGNELSFTTLTGQAPTVKTIFASSITDTSFASGGIVISNGGLPVTVRGLCWSTNRMYPTISDSTIVISSPADTFPLIFTHLHSDTLYYVRAFATNTVGTSYGTPIAVHTTPDTVNGLLQSLFSVSPTRKVRFSKGNLQWSATDSHAVAGQCYAPGTWRFAQHQYEYIGLANNNISSSNTAWIDLFGYGTSGYNNRQPYTTSNSFNDYVDSNISCTYYDWGTYNAISNGGNIPGYWRTLMGHEWNYLINTRQGAHERFGMGTVDSIRGTILLPDLWNKPDGLPDFIPGISLWANSYTIAQWEIMENNGAVFLPNAGNRNGTNTVNIGSFGLYWGGGKQSRSQFDNIQSSPSYFFVHIANPFFGSSVRLVRDV